MSWGGVIQNFFHTTSVSHFYSFIHCGRFQASWKHRYILPDAFCFITCKFISLLWPFPRCNENLVSRNPRCFRIASHLLSKQQLDCYLMKSSAVSSARMQMMYNMLLLTAIFVPLAIDHQLQKKKMKVSCSRSDEVDSQKYQHESYVNG